MEQGVIPRSVECAVYWLAENPKHSARTATLAGLTSWVSTYILYKTAAQFVLGWESAYSLSLGNIGNIGNLTLTTLKQGLYGLASAIVIDKVGCKNRTGEWRTPPPATVKAWENQFWLSMRSSIPAVGISVVVPLAVQSGGQILLLPLLVEGSAWIVSEIGGSAAFLFVSIVGRVAVELILPEELRDQHYWHDRIAELLSKESEKREKYRLNTQTLSRGPSKIILDPEIELDAAAWTDLVEKAGCQDKKGTFGSSYTELLLSHSSKQTKDTEERSRFRHLLHNAGAAIAKIEEVEKRKCYVTQLADACDACSTRVSNVIEAILLDLQFDGHGVSERIHNYNYKVKGAVVSEILAQICPSDEASLTDIDPQHLRTYWSRQPILGEKLGLPIPAGVDGDKLTFPRGTWHAYRAQEQAIVDNAPALQELFLQRYTPSLLIQQWMDVTRSQEKDDCALACSLLEFFKEFGYGDFDALVEAGHYNDEGQLTEQGAVFLLTAAETLEVP